MRPAASIPLLLASILSAPAGAQCQLWKLTLPFGKALDRFGFALAMHGTTAAISSTGKGRVVVYDLQTGKERQAIKWTNAPGSSAYFGWSVDLNDDWVIVGCPGELFEEGSASVFDLATGLEVYQLRPSDSQMWDSFGWSVAVEGDMAIVGAKGTLGSPLNEGAVYVFDLTTGQQTAKLTVPGSCYLGESIDVSGNLVVAAECQRAHVFDVTTGAYVRELRSTVGTPYEIVDGVAIDGDVALVGDACNGTIAECAGAVFVFDVTTGAETSRLVSHEWEAFEYYSSVALQGDLAAVGPYEADTVYLFDARTGAQVAEIVSPDWEPADRFGRNLALGPDRILISASGDGDKGNLAGAAHVYRLSMPEVATYCAPANPNSTGLPARARAAGDPTDCDRVLLAAQDLPPNEIGFFLVSRTKSFAVPPGSQGNLCLGGAIGHYDVQDSGATGSFETSVDMTALPQPFGSVAVQPGETWNFQAWFRDHNPGPTSNFTDGLSITFR